MLLAAEPFKIDDEAAGFVLAAQPMAGGLVPYIGGIFRLFLVSGLAALAIAFVVVYFISYRLVRPVHDMANATRQYARGEFGYRVQARGDDELRQLADAFNSMAISLANLESSRRSFVANVSHELKTPMTSIGGFIDGMLDGTIPEEQRRRYLTLVSEEVKRLSRLVTGMLNLSKIEDGELQLNLTPFDVNELLFTTALRFERIIADKELELVGLDTLEPVTLPGDRDMLTQVFYNLIDNAVKFTPRGERLEFTGRTDRGIYRFALRNTGVGVSSEELARIFERFYKTDKSRSFDVKGAGLGLYLAQTIVKMHGGTISAKSDGESWTEVIVELPC
jgi:signal transduction histidine kinase